jgi:phosphate-selective porin OprO/OprP
MRSAKQALAVHALAAAACLGAAAGPAAARPVRAKPADPRDAQIEALVRQVETLSAKVEVLEAKVAAPPAAPAAPPPPPPPAPILTLAPPPPLPSAGATITAGKPQIQSGDGRFVANLHGVMQFDAADYEQRTPGPITADFRRGAAAADTAHARDLSSGTNFRRARIGVDGKAFGDFEYNLLFEFGGAGEEDAGHIQEMWIQYSGYKPVHLRIGAFPPSIGLEDQASTNGALFLERPASADMARSLAGGDFREAVQIWAAGERWYASGAVTGRVVGVVNSQATGVSQPFDSSLGLIGRLAVAPIKTDEGMLHLGVHGSYVARPADAGGPDAAATAVRYGITFQERPELRVDGTRLISTGAIDARHARTLGLEAAAQYRSLFLQGEYERFDIDRRNVAAAISNPDFKGYYLEGSWIATGERRRYNPGTFAFDGPLIDHPFSPSQGTWGALELAGRWSVADLNYHQGAAGAAAPADGVRGGEQRIFAAGVNWYPNTFVRFLLDYQDVRVRRLSPSAATFSTPAGAQVGQHYHAISLRSQFAF